MKLFVTFTILCNLLNVLSESEIAPSVVLSPVPGVLLSIDYWYSQTGKVLQDTHPDSEETQAPLEDVGTEEELEGKGFEESGLDSTVGLLDVSDPDPVTPSSAPGPAVSTLTAPEQQLVILIVE